MKLSITLATLLVASLTWAQATPTTTVKYAGTVDFTQNRIHKDGVKGAIQLSFDGDELKSVLVKTTAPVFGKTELTSSEQAVFSAKTDDSNAQMTVVWKFAGAPHKWYYVFIAKTSDAGVNYSGDIYKGDTSMDEIKKALNSGSVPGTWVKEGVGSLTATY